MISAKNLTKVYGGVAVLNIPEITIAKGESFGLVGNNGAGKTTFFRLILDLIRPQTGMVTSKDRNVAGREEWKNYTGSYLDRNFLIDYLTPEEYFGFSGKVHGMSEEDISQFLEEMKDFFNDEVLGKKKLIRDLSRGNQQKIGVATALMANPEVLVLDEPFNSLDPSSQFRLKNMLGKLKQEKQVTMLISSHDLNHVNEVCDRIAILEKGIIVKDLRKTDKTLQELQSYFAV
jgi:ABC-2 type transport system ATP-binding protein